MAVWWLYICVLLAWCVFRYRRRHMYKLAENLPEISGSLPFIGHAHKAAANTEEIMTALQLYTYEAMEHDGVAKAWLGHILYFIQVNPVDCEWILKTCLEKDDLHRFLRNLFGNGGVFAPVPIWRRRRKVMVPTFSPRIVDNYVEVFAEQSEKLAERLAERVDKGAFSFWPYISTYSLDAICETVMGVNVKAQENPDSPFLLAINSALHLICERIFQLWLQPDWLYRFFPQYPDHQRSIKIMHEFTDEVITKKREELKNQKQSQNQVISDQDVGVPRRKTFLDLLISLSGGEKGYKDEELREEVLMLTVAGTDTSAVTVGFTLKLLGKYPAVQEKVFQELHEVFGDSDRLLVKEDLIKLKYLDRVVKESLRLFPPGPFIIRKVLEDTKLPSSGHVLPAGSGVMVSIWGVHRDPKYWGPDAEHFDPDRFLPERFKLQHACSYMPFSHGPRNCLGYQYALMSIKTVLSTLLRRYKVVCDEEPTPIPHIKVKLNIMMKPVDDHQLAFVKRQPYTTNI